MRYYKLTDRDRKTYDNTCWEVGVTCRAIGKGKELCSADVIHLYDHPLKAVLFNPIHAVFSFPRLWEVKAAHIVANDGLKVGAKEVTLIREIPVPVLTTNQKVRFAIYCALAVYDDKKFKEWANRWLSGEERGEAAAEAAAGTARAAAREAAWAAAEAAAGTARAAAGAAARAAAEAAEAAAHTNKIEFVRLAKKAIKEEE